MGDSCVRSAFQSAPAPDIQSNLIQEAGTTAATTTTTEAAISTTEAGLSSSTTVSSTTVKRTTVLPPASSIESRRYTTTTTTSNSFDFLNSLHFYALLKWKKQHSCSWINHFATTMFFVYFAPKQTSRWKAGTSLTIHKSLLKSFSITGPISTTTAIRNRGEDGRGSVSLGLPCVTDLQCRAADPSSRCIEGVCDCIIRTNATNGCSARNRGCIPGTFQVRKTRILNILWCISTCVVLDVMLLSPHISLVRTTKPGGMEWVFVESW